MIKLVQSLWTVHKSPFWEKEMHRASVFVVVTVILFFFIMHLFTLIFFINLLILSIGARNSFPLYLTTINSKENHR